MNKILDAQVAKETPLMTRALILVHQLLRTAFFMESNGFHPASPSFFS